MKYPRRIEVKLTEEQYESLQQLADELGTATGTTARNLITKALIAHAKKSTNV